MNNENIVITLSENKLQEKKKFIYNDIAEKINNLYITDDTLYPFIVDYKTNYTKKELIRIAEYYEIKNFKRKKKDEIINLIIFFETNINNQEIVFQRKTLWFYLEEILNDKYLSKFVILN